MFTKGINFYYEVISEDDNNGYIEIKDVIFKDDNNQYYKVLNNLTSFPPEYDDKIYFYKETFEDNDYYFSSKSTRENLNDDSAVLYDTYQCENESCDVVSSYDQSFLINDNSLILYDTSKKTTRKINISDEIINDEIDFELISNSKHKIIGILLKKEYIDNYICSTFCYDEGLSGYEIGYYSFNSNTFTIALDYGIIGFGIHDEYDIAMIIQKDNKIGIFSYEDDEMLLDLSNDYYSASYDSSLNAVALLVRGDDDLYYYKYFNLSTKSFKLDTKKLLTFDNSNIFYTTKITKQGLNMAMLFNTKGESFKNLPYLVYDTIKDVSDMIITYSDGYYTNYDLDGTLLYKSMYPREEIIKFINPSIIMDGKNIGQLDKNAYVIINVDGKYALEIANKKYIELCDINDANDVVKIEKDISNKILYVYVKENNVIEEDKNGYKFRIIYDESTEKYIVTSEMVTI